MLSLNEDVGNEVLADVGPQWRFEDGFYTFQVDQESDLLTVRLGTIPKLKRFTACFRYEPFWMSAKAASSLAEAPTETQFLLAELEGGRYAVVAPLIDARFRCALQGTPDGALEVVAESGDAAVRASQMTAVYVASGSDPYDLVEAAARKVAKRLGCGRLRTEKPMPDFVDAFGWCTWDSFYTEVTAEKIREGLESFRKGGVEPRFLIVDDGWLAIETLPDTTRRLTSFTPDAQKFPGGLAPTVQMAKSEFKVETVLAWHAMMGYWSGVSESLGYGGTTMTRKASPGIQAHQTKIDWWGPTVHLAPKENAYRFFQDFHRELRRAGIDGVKVDTQSALELISEGSGGRVPLMLGYREALEGSVAVHFGGNLINCMSCASEMLYSANVSSLTRTSTDFWPDRPETHGEHLYVNAQVGVWFGEFIHPDWDMFQSGHAAGAFHAAGRAVSGGPAYVSDKPDGHDFELLRKLALPNGKILRGLRPGRPTLDCLMRNPTAENALLKIFTPNPLGAVVGAFNARYAKEGKPAAIKGSVSPADAHGLAGKRFAMHAHTSGETRTVQREDRWEIELPELGYELFAIVPIEDGFAPLGLPAMLNGGGAVRSLRPIERGWEVSLAYGGEFLAYAEEEVAEVRFADRPLAFEHGPDRLLRVETPSVEAPTLQILLKR